MPQCSVTWARDPGVVHQDVDLALPLNDALHDGGNVLVAGSGAAARLAGLLDVGGTGPADPALDLVGAWHLLDDGPRDVFRTALGVEEAEWRRGVAWAFEQAVGLVWYYRTTNPVMSAQGRRTLERLLRAYGPPAGTTGHQRANR